MNADPFALPSLAGRIGLKRTLAARQAQSEARRLLGLGLDLGRAGKVEKLACSSWKPKTCQWLEGEARERNFCGDSVKTGSSYCERHHSICYEPAPVKVER